jgi:hypothetical protein
MTCPRCHSEFEDGKGVCPECGVRFLRNVSGVMKTSAVMIAAGGERGFYRSVQDVPEPLRTQLIETTTSSNSGIIVIADRAGKEQLTQVMARREAGRDAAGKAQFSPSQMDPAQFGGDEDIVVEPAGSPALAALITRMPWLAWAGFIAVLVVAATLFAIFHTEWPNFHPHW